MLIRLASARDAGSVQTIYAPIVESTPISFELAVPSEDEFAIRITERQPAYPWLVAEGRHGVEGYAYAGRFAARPAYAWTVETSVYVTDAARERGVGRALYTALLTTLAAQGYRQALAGITLPNPASVRLHERMGFTAAGVYRAVGWKFGAWHDVGWWQRELAGAEDGSPRTPVPLTALPPDVLDAAFAGT